MIRAPSTGLVLRPIAEEDEPELRRIHATTEVSRWWGPPDESFPRDEPEVARLTIEVEGRVVGLIQFSDELDPKYRHASIDLFLDPAIHRRGIGSESLRRVARHLIEERGHHRITIDPAAANTAATRAYEKVGFRPSCPAPTGLRPCGQPLGLAGSLGRSPRRSRGLAAVPS